MRRLARPTLALALAASAACASSGATAAPPDQSRFAPQLGVNMAAMTEQRGVWVRDIAPGVGQEVTRGKSIAVFYRAQLTNGTTVDSLLAPAAPLRFRVGSGNVIPGWDRGLVGMKAGGTRQLVVPPELAYGYRATDRVPGGSTLVFVIEVVDVR